MTTLFKHSVLACLVILTAALGGCVKFKQTSTVMPDGSGKFEMVIGLSEQLVQMSKQQGEDPFSDLDPKELAKESKGIVAFTRPTQTKKDGYTYMTFSAYFEDINAVELGNPEDEQPAAKFSYVREGDAATLTVTDSMILAMIQDYEPIGPEEKQFAAAMMAGMLFTDAYVLPGPFEEIKGVKGVDNTATVEVTQDDMLNGTGPIKDLKGVEKLVFKITAVKEDAEAMKAFKAELEAAKKEWEQIKKEAQAAE